MPVFDNQGKLAKLFYAPAPDQLIEQDVLYDDEGKIFSTGEDECELEVMWVAGTIPASASRGDTFTPMFAIAGNAGSASVSYSFEGGHSPFAGNLSEFVTLQPGTFTITTSFGGPHGIVGVQVDTFAVPGSYTLFVTITDTVCTKILEYPINIT